MVCHYVINHVSNPELATIIKKGWVVKRSRGRGKSKNAANYRERFVVLTEEFLCYYGTEIAVSNLIVIKFSRRI